MLKSLADRHNSLTLNAVFIYVNAFSGEALGLVVELISAIDWTGSSWIEKPVVKLMGENFEHNLS